MSESENTANAAQSTEISPANGEEMGKNQPLVESEEPIKGNVTQFKGKKGRPKKEAVEGETPPDDVQKPPAKLPIGQIEHDLVSVLERQDITEYTPHPLRSVPLFDQHYEAFRSRLVDEVCLAEVRDNTAYLTTKNNIASDFAEFCGNLSCKVYNIALSRAESIVKRWAYKRRELKPIPPPWGFKSDPALCFNRLPYDPIHRDDWDLSLSLFAPTFSAMCQRVNNLEAFQAMIGSIFFLKASRKQVLWLYGPTGGGKSQIACLLNALMGDAAIGFDNDDFDGAFWKADLLDKRTVYLDEGDPVFLQSNTFKALTGKRGKRINQKHLNAFQANINTILFASSNPPPEIPNDPAIISRVVPCYVQPLEDSAKIPELEVEERFLQEAGYIAGFCMSVYRRLCPTFGAVPFDMELHLQPSIDTFEADFLDILEARFKKGKPTDWVSNQSMKRILHDCGLYEMSQQRKFKDFLKSRFPEMREDREERIVPRSTSRARGFGGIITN